MKFLLNRLLSFELINRILQTMVEYLCKYLDKVWSRVSIL